MAIEFRSFSKTAGFTGVRCGYVVVPKELKLETKSGDLVSANKLWDRRQCTKFNGCSYVVQRGAEAVYTEAGQRQIQETLGIYRKNALTIFDRSKRNRITGFRWNKQPLRILIVCTDGMSSWDFFDFLLREAQVMYARIRIRSMQRGRGVSRLTAFNIPAGKTAMAVKRLKTAVKNIQIKDEDMSTKFTDRYCRAS